MMELTVTYLGDAQFEAEARGHKVLCDQPAENGGADEGMTPPEFLLASLATCAGFYAMQYLKTHSLPTSGLRVHIGAGKVAGPARLDNFVISIDAPGAVTDKDVEGVKRSVEKCLIKNTLLSPPSIRTEVNVGHPALP